MFGLCCESFVPVSFGTAALILSLLVCVSAVRADTLSGTVKDPSGAVIAGARIEITGATLPQPVILNSDEGGKFSAPNLPPGKYTVHITQDGFNESVSQVDLKGTANLDLKLTLAEQQISVNISAKSMAFANSDPLYRQLRGTGLGDSYHCENVTFSMDLGNFQLQSGTLTFLLPVDGKITGAIFVGQGHFSLKPAVQARSG